MNSVLSARFGVVVFVVVNDDDCIAIEIFK